MFSPETLQVPQAKAELQAAGQAAPLTPGDLQQRGSRPPEAEQEQVQVVHGKAAELTLPAEEAATGGESEELLEEGEEGSLEEGQPSEKPRREYTRWTPEEEKVFYDTLKTVAGQKPEKCLTEISKMLPTKDYTQVRHYYYRLLKRLNKILGEERRLDSKNNLQVHRSMVKFWEVFVQNGMRGTCLVGVLKKPRKKKAFNTGVQKGVEQVVRRVQQAEERAAKRKAAAGVEAHVAGNAGSVEEGSAPPSKRGKGQKKGGSAQPAVSEHLMQTGASGSIDDGCHASASGPAHSQTGNNEAGRGGGAVAGDTAEGSEMAGGGGGRTTSQQQRQLHMSSALSFRSTSQGASAAALGGLGGKAADKLTVRLLPWDGTVEAVMQSAGYNPFLELTCSASKSLLSMLKHLSGKWARALPPAEPQCIWVHPSHDCPISVRGIKWGGPACDPQLKLGDIFLTLQCPSPFQLLYSWEPCEGFTAAQPMPGYMQLHGTGGMLLQQALPAPELASGPGGMPEPFMQLLNSRTMDAVLQMTGQQQQAGPSLGAQLAGAAPLSFGAQEGDGGGWAYGGAAPPQQGPGLELPHSMPPGSPAGAGPGSGLLPGGIFHGSLPPGAGDSAAAQPGQKAPAKRASKPRAKRATPATAGTAAAAAAPIEPPEGRGASEAQGPLEQPAGADAAEAPASEARKPRGLLGLLQQRPLPAGKAPAKKSGKASGAAKRSRKGGGSRQSKQQEQAMQAPFAPLPAANPFSWQHPQPPPMLLQQQQQQAPRGQWLPEAAGVNTHSLLNFLDAHTCAGLPGMSNLCTPGREQQGQEQAAQDAVPLLPSSDLAGGLWGSLSPPSNFMPLAGFDAAPPPKSKDAARAAAEVKGGGSKGPLGFGLPTDFSQLFASMDSQPASEPSILGTVAALGGGANEGANRPTAAARGAVDALFGQAGCSGAAAGAAGRSAPSGQNADPNPLPPLGERDLEQLTMSFGSLLGVGDTPSWLQLPGADAGRPAEPASDRPFAALFGK